MRQKDIKFLLLDLKDQQAEERILEIKKKYSKLILISLILIKFSVFMAQYIQFESAFTQLEQNNFDLITIVVFIFGYFFCQITTGFMTDLISVQSSWIFTWFLAILSIAISLWRFYVKNEGVGIFGQILIACARTSIYVNGTYLIFDTSYTLNVRFNYSALFIIISSFVSQYIFLGISLFAGEQKKLCFTILMFVCLFLSIICGVTVSIAYKQIENVKENIRTYQDYLRFRGIGLSVKGIFSYYSNQNMLFLLVLTFISSLFQKNEPSHLLQILQEKSEEFVNNSQFSSFFLQSQNLGNIFITYFIIKYLNKSKRKVQTFFENLNHIMRVCLVVYVYSIIFISLSDYISGVMLAIIFIIIQIYQGYVGITVHLITNQINYCLHNEKSQIKCIAFGVIGFFQNLPSLFFLIPTFTSDQVPVSYCIQTGLAFCCVIYTNYFLKDKKFDLLESQISEQFNTTSSTDLSNNNIDSSEIQSSISQIT